MYVRYRVGDTWLILLHYAHKIQNSVLLETDFHIYKNQTKLWHGAVRTLRLFGYKTIQTRDRLVSTWWNNLYNISNNQSNTNIESTMLETQSSLLSVSFNAYKSNLLQDRESPEPEVRISSACAAGTYTASCNELFFRPYNEYTTTPIANHTETRVHVSVLNEGMN